MGTNISRMILGDKHAVVVVVVVGGGGGGGGCCWLFFCDQTPGSWQFWGAGGCSKWLPHSAARSKHRDVAEGSSSFTFWNQPDQPTMNQSEIVCVWLNLLHWLPLVWTMTLELHDFLWKDVGATRQSANHLFSGSLTTFTDQTYQLLDPSLEWSFHSFSSVFLAVWLRSSQMMDILTSVPSFAWVQYNRIWYNTLYIFIRICIYT